MKKRLLLLLSLCSIGVGILLIGGFGISFIKKYVPFDFDKTTAVIAVKESEIRLSSFPGYYIYVKTRDDEISRHKVTKNTMMTVRVGAEIEGYNLKERFYTKRDIITDWAVYALFFLIGWLFVLLGMIFILRKTVWLQKLKTRTRNLKGRAGETESANRKSKPDEAKTAVLVKYWVILVVVMFLAWEQVYHLSLIHSQHHGQVQANIMEVERKPGYGRFAGPKFIFTVGYMSDAKEPIFTKLKVSKKMFDLYDPGDTLVFHYPDKNPYYLYLPKK